MATSFLLVSYYIFLSKCCFSRQQLDPLRRFSSLSSSPPRNDDPFLITYSPSLHSHGLDELLIREIPTFQYARGESTSTTIHKCVVCLNEFQEQEVLRILPKCGHGFHLDCIDIWLQSNANCPTCRLSISGERKYPVDQIVALTSSPQDPQPFLGTRLGGDEDFVVIEMTGTDTTEMQPERSGSSTEQKLDKVKFRKFHHVSIMGDECIDVRERDRDDQFGIQLIRRSFSMDSAADPKVYLAVQEIIRQNAGLSEVRKNEESSSRGRRSFFPFGHGRGSRNWILPIEF